jgi:hypothetical protein
MKSTSRPNAEVETNESKSIVQQNVLLFCIAVGILILITGVSVAAICWLRRHVKASFVKEPSRAENGISEGDGEAVAVRGSTVGYSVTGCIDTGQLDTGLTVHLLINEDESAAQLSNKSETGPPPPGTLNDIQEPIVSLHADDSLCSTHAKELWTTTST